jgi:hypothetical protein
LAYIKTEQKLLQLQNEYFAICVMAIFSKIPDSSLAEFKRELAPYLSTLPFPAGQWLKDETEIKNTLLKNIEQKENLIGKLETFLGNQTHELRQERAAAIADWVANGMTQTEAEEFINSLLSVSNPDSLTAKHAKIEEAENELAELNQKLRKKFAPSPDDPDYVLIQKISIFQKAYMPEDALQTLQLLRRKTDGNISPELCDIIEHIIKMPDPPFNYGQMVLFFEPPATEHPVYMPGDIIVKCGGKDIRTYEDYQGKTGKNVEFYRFNKNSGIFEVMTAVMPEGAPRTALEDAPVPDVNLY